MFCPATADALRRFQAARGLHIDGTCDGTTWSALVEASWELGDRLLYLTSPMLRGDDVAELQNLLGRLGFDTGRVDGIYGPQTAEAVGDLQRNCGLQPDGMCGHDTVRAVRRVSRQTGAGPGVAALRELEALRRGRTLVGLRVVVGQFGGLSALGRKLSRRLARRGALVDPIDALDATSHAQAANHFGADLYLGIEGRPERHATIAYYAVPAFESAGGRALARLTAPRLADALGEVAVDVVGMRLPVLRETRMPAVLCTLGPVRQVVDRSPQVADALLDAVAAWTQSTVDRPV